MNGLPFTASGHQNPVARFIYHSFGFVFACLLYTVSWFSLWNISRYLAPDMLLAGMLLPSGLRLAVLSLSRRDLWLWFTLLEIALLSIIFSLLDCRPSDYILLIFPVTAYWLALIFQTIWHPLQTYWQKLLALTGLIILYAFICGGAMLLLVKPLGLPAHYALDTTISTITGGILITPFLYLLYDYLRQQSWDPLTPTIVHQEVTLSPFALLWCLLFFGIGLAAELTLLESMKPLALMLFLLPNIFMAYRYGWRGGVLASLMNSILLTTARQITGSFESDIELQSFIATQAFVGLGLGIAISRQYLLAHQLHNTNQMLAKELASKQQLTRQLIQVEEEIRKSVARELHDEIGQNITAIQIQATLAKRLARDEQYSSISDTIHSLALRIHSSTRQLLTQLRPYALDELGIENAIRHLVDELKFAERHVDFRLNFGIFAERLEDITAVTLFRIVQELLNNVCKHSEATEVQLSLLPGDTFSLEIRDNGRGIPPDWRSRGQGLRGIEERVSALGGQFTIKSHRIDVGSQPDGTRIIVNLPTKLTPISHN